MPLGGYRELAQSQPLHYSSACLTDPTKQSCLSTEKRSHHLLQAKISPLRH